MKKSLLQALLLFCTSFLLPMGCSDRSSATGNPSTIVSSISTGVQVVGAGLRTSSRNQISRPTTSSCDSHGYPNGISGSDGRYPGYLTYCFLTVDSGDSVLGGFALPTKVACLLNSLGVVYDGASHNYTMTSAIISACNMTGSGLTDGMELAVTGSSPASFNTNYANGVVVALTSAMGLTFKMAFNVSGTKSSFITSETWDTGSIGTSGGAIDTATGEVWYESRVERETCSTSSSCGFNRHSRMHALVTMSGTTPTALNSLTFGYSNIQFTPAQNGLGGTLITAKGDLTDGIKARYWSISPSSVSEYNTADNWSETTNTKCYTSSSETATTCGSGLNRFTTNTKFALHSTDGHTSVTNWFAGITGQTFANVDVDSDTQY